jgi:hypothetical protein
MVERGDAFVLSLAQRGKYLYGEIQIKNGDSTMGLSRKRFAKLSLTGQAPGSQIKRIATNARQVLVQGGLANGE